MSSVSSVDFSAEPAPVALFVYKRADHAAMTLSALRQNALAKNTDVYIFSDGPKGVEDRDAVQQVRALIEGVEGFASVTVRARDQNIGLAQSVISGVTEIVNKHGRVIVIEDDLITHPSTLLYFNQTLDHFQDHLGVFSISAYNYPQRLMQIPEDYEYDVYAIPRMQCWGWATWADRWAKADFDVPDFQRFNSSKTETEAYGHWIGNDSLNTLRLCMAGEKDVWACRWVYTHFRNHAVCICPTRSYIDNIGLDGSGMNCGASSRLSNDLNDERPSTLRLPDVAFVDPRIFDAFMGVVDPDRVNRLDHAGDLPANSVNRNKGKTLGSARPPSMVARVRYWGSNPLLFVNRLVSLMKNWLASKLTAYSAKVHESVQSTSTVPLIRLGTNYGGWWVPESGLGKDDLIVSAGAGEDISFDVELSNRFGSQILVVDPTPRAVAHFESTKDLVTKGEPAPINHDSSMLYDATAKTFASMRYLKLGLWDKNTTIRFFSPANEKHVSHSIDNLHNTEGGFDAEVVQLEELMRRANVDKVTVLKMDVEGAEFAVIDDMLKGAIRPWFLLIEFHAGQSKLEKVTKFRTARYLKKLAKCGYRLVANRGWDYVFELQK